MISGQPPGSFMCYLQNGLRVCAEGEMAVS